MHGLLSMCLTAWHALRLVSAVPLLPSLEDLNTALTRHPESVSTELTLAMGRSTPAQHVESRVERPMEASSTWFNHHPPAPVSPANAAYSAAGHSEDKRQVAQAIPEREGGYSSRPSAVLNPIALTQGSIRIPGASNLDRFPTEMLKVPHWSGWLLLPNSMTYIEPPWLTDFYTSLLSQMQRKKNFDHSKVDIPEHVLEQLLVGRKSFYTKQGSFYKMYFFADSESFPGAGNGPMEVLFKFHGRLDLGGNRPLINLVSFWSTVDHGRCLALLGIFHISEKAFGDLAKLPGVQKLNIEPRIAPDGSIRAYLVPSTQ